MRVYNPSTWTPLFTLLHDFDSAERAAVVVVEGMGTGEEGRGYVNAEKLPRSCVVEKYHKGSLPRSGAGKLVTG